MTPVVDIVIPTLWRHERLADVVANIHETTMVRHRILFVAESHDVDTRATIRAMKDPDVKLVLNKRTPNCCGAFNTGFAAVTAPYWFAGGDDLKFHDLWDCKTLDIMIGDPKAKIVGTNDWHNANVLAGLTATHFLVDTEYARTYGLTFDEEPGIVACEEYGHDFFDTEACLVASTRGVFRPCLYASVEHVHWCFALADVDRTYQRNQELCKADPETYGRRKADWEAKQAA